MMLSCFSVVLYVLILPVVYLEKKSSSCSSVTPRASCINLMNKLILSLARPLSLSLFCFKQSLVNETRESESEKEGFKIQQEKDELFKIQQERGGAD